MAGNYTDLLAEIQRWADNDNANFVAAIPDFVQDCEKWVSRHLHVRNMECITTTPLAPSDVTEDELGVYALPDDWGGHKGVYQSADGATLVLHYWTRVPPLSQSNQTNWLLDKWPDLYRYGSLMSAEAFLKNDPRIATWAQKAGVILTEIEEHDVHDLYGGGPLRSRSKAERPWHDQNAPGRYDYLPPYDFLDLVTGGEDFTDCQYFTVTQSEIRIWPKPAMPETP